MPLQFIFDWVYQDLRQKHANAKYIWCKSERKRWDNQPITHEQITLIKKLAPDYKINTKKTTRGMHPLSFKICCISGRQVIKMPRRPRKISGSGIYHVMIRGINKMQIFNDDADNIQFLHFLEYTQTDDFQILAYCLMGNHAHLLIRTSKNSIEALETGMKSLCIRYAAYYNRKYERIGTLFQDRYKSQPVTTVGYFLLRTALHP